MSATLLELLENKNTDEKGKSLLELADCYTVVDLETTGLDPKVDEIIEIGAVKVVDNEISDSFQSLVKPNCEISDFITSLTGIDNEMVADAPCLKDILGKLLVFIGDDIVVGHNVNFDVNFIIAGSLKCFKRGFSNNFIDTMRISRKLYPQEKHHRLCDLEERFCLHNENAHRALSDVMLTKKCYDHMKNYVDSSGLSLLELMHQNKIKI